MQSNTPHRSSSNPQSEVLFREILRIYDLADDVLGAVAREGVLNKETQFKIAAPFVTEVINCADVLAALYIDVAKKNVPITPELQSAFEKASNSIFYAYKDFMDKIENTLFVEVAL